MVNSLYVRENFLLKLPHFTLKIFLYNYLGINFPYEGNNEVIHIMCKIWYS